jgi:hypothetical protein
VPLGEGGEGGEDGDVPTQQSASKSTVRQALTMALPLVLSDLLFYLITFVALLYAGHLGPSRFAAAILATMITNVTGFSVGIGSKPPKQRRTSHQTPSRARGGVFHSFRACSLCSACIACAHPYPLALLSLPAHSHTLSLSFSLSLTHTHTHTRARA